MKNFRSICLLSVAALAGCGEPSYEQCIRDAVKDGKSEYGTKLLTNLCRQAKSKREEIADNKCFTKLTVKFGKAAVENYKFLLGGSTGQCDPSVDVPSWVIEEGAATEAPAEAADAVVEGAIMDAADAAVEGAATAQ